MPGLIPKSLNLEGEVREEKFSFLGMAGAKESKGGRRRERVWMM